MSLSPEPASKILNEAPLIVRGKISGKGEPTWGKFENESRQIYTVYTLRINEVLKGTPPSDSNIQFRELGGEKDGMGMKIEGTAEFQDGEDVVVLLDPKNGEGTFDLHGMTLGKISIASDDSGQEKLTGAALAAEPVENRTLSNLRKLVNPEIDRKSVPSGIPTQSSVPPKGNSGDPKTPVPIESKGPTGGPVQSITQAPQTWTDWNLFWKLWLIGEGLWFITHSIIIVIKRKLKDRKNRPPKA